MKAKTLKGFVSASSFLGLLAALLFVPAAGAQQFSDWCADSPAVNLGPVVNSSCAVGATNCNDQHPALSKDGLSLYFSSDRPGGCGGLDLWVTTRASVDDPWETPFPLGCTINSSANDLAPSLSTDGHSLYFHSFRSGGCGGGDIYYAHRKNRREDHAEVEAAGGWEPPLNLNRFGRDPEASLICGGIGDFNFVNTPNTDAGPNYFQDEAGVTVLYFTRSDQPTMAGDFDIYLSTLAADGTWGDIVKDDELSTTPFRDTRTAIRRRDGLEMIMSTERPRPDGLTDIVGGTQADPRDLWVSTRPSTQDPWSAPEPLPRPNVNSTALDGAPALSWDGTTLIFFSGRGGTSARNDLFMCTRTKLTEPQ